LLKTNSSNLEVNLYCRTGAQQSLTTSGTFIECSLALKSIELDCPKRDMNLNFHHSYDFPSVTHHFSSPRCLSSLKKLFFQPLRLEADHSTQGLV
jgi:hypothetical protein